MRIRFKINRHLTSSIVGKKKQIWEAPYFICNYGTCRLTRQSSAPHTIILKFPCLFSIYALVTTASGFCLDSDCFNCNSGEDLFKACSITSGVWLVHLLSFQPPEKWPSLFLCPFCDSFPPLSTSSWRQAQLHVLQPVCLTSMLVT